jgi:hypothetical protein
VIGALTALGLWDGEATNLRPFKPAPNGNGEFALRIWNECAPAHGTPVETYLASRGITIPIPETIRFHGRLKYPGGGFWPAMVALVERGKNAVAIHRTYLRHDGSGKAPVPDGAKKMLGPCVGGAVRLSPPGYTLVVGEGIETCLSVLQASGKPTWAALSTSGLKGLELPDVARDIVIATDADEAGEAAACEAGRKWRDAGLVVRIARPAGSFRDFNDMLKSGGAA